MFRIHTGLTAILLGVLVVLACAGTSAGDNGYSQLRLQDSYTPTGTVDPNGNTGDIAWDANYFYVKTSEGWKRAALSTF